MDPLKPVKIGNTGVQVTQIGYGGGALGDATHQ